MLYVWNVKVFEYVWEKLPIQLPAYSSHNYLPSSEKKYFNMLTIGPPFSRSIYFLLLVPEVNSVLCLVLYLGIWLTPLPFPDPLQLGYVTWVQ